MATSAATAAAQYAFWAPGLNVPLQIAGYYTANASLKLQSIASLVVSPVWQDEVTTTGTTNSTFGVATTKTPGTTAKFYRMVDMTR